MGANIDKMKGKAKQAEGKLTGDKARMGQGKVEEAKADVERAANRAATRVKSGFRRASAKVEGKIAETRARVRNRNR